MIKIMNKLNELKNIYQESMIMDFLFRNIHNYFFDYIFIWISIIINIILFSFSWLSFMFYFSIFITFILILNLILIKKINIEYYNYIWIWSWDINWLILLIYLFFFFIINYKLDYLIILILIFILLCLILFVLSPNFKLKNWKIISMNWIKKDEEFKELENKINNFLYWNWEVELIFKKEYSTVPLIPVLFLSNIIWLIMIILYYLI